MPKLSSKNINNNAQITSFKVFLPFFGEEFKYAQAVTLPGLTVNPIEAFPGSGTRALTIGDSMSFTDCTVTFLLDEKYDIYKKLVKLFTDRINPVTGVDQNLEFTAGIEITDNLGNSILAFEMYGCHFSDFPPIMLMSSSEDQEIQVDLTFRFDRFELVDYVNTEGIGFTQS